MKRNSVVVAAVVLSAVLLAAPPIRLSGQSGVSQPQAEASPSLSNERDIAARKKALSSESSDLEEMAKSLKGTEFDAALQLDNKASDGVMELDATAWFLALYDKMQCEPDRKIAKDALKNRLGFYSYLLGLEADQAAGELAFTKLPATAQAGAQVKDDLRAAKSKLDEIAASLK